MERENSNNIVYKIMQDVGISCNTEICQYLDLDYLQDLLAKEKYYVKRKSYFVDKRERNIPFKSYCILSQANKQLSSNQQAEEDTLIESASHYEKESSLLLTSCWTERITENALMWDRGGERHKACIKSTIANFVASFGQTDYTIWCGKMLYEYLQPSLVADDVIWYKEPYFSNEQEIRFYFSKDFNKVTPDDGTGDHVLLSVNTKQLINEIRLSPYIEKNAANEMKKLFQEKYGIVTNLSKVEIWK